MCLVDAAQTQLPPSKGDSLALQSQGRNVAHQVWCLSGQDSAAHARAGAYELPAASEAAVSAAPPADLAEAGSAAAAALEAGAAAAASAAAAAAEAEPAVAAPQQSLAPLEAADSAVTHELPDPPEKRQQDPSQESEESA